MGCSINPLSWGECAGDLLGKAAGGLASAGFDAVAQAFASGVGKIVATLATFWTSVPTTALSGDTGSPVGMLNAMLDWLMLVVGILSVFLVAIQLAITHRGDALADAGIGLVRFVLINATQLPALALLAGAGDAFSSWIVNVAAGGNFGTRVTEVFGASLASGLGSALVFIGALLAIFASLAQVIAMVARNGILILTAAASPIAAAAAIYKGNDAMWRRLWMWQLAFVLYKPTAAFVYAAAFVTVGDGKDATDALSGLALMIMSVLALPALLRLMMPVAARMGSGGAGAAALAGGVAVASGVASVVSARRATAALGGGGSGGGGAGGGGPSGAAPSAVPRGSGPAGAAGSGAAGAGSAGAGAAGAAGPVAAGVQLATAAVGAARRTATNATQTPGAGGEPVSSADSGAGS
jgi:hypothetical protein